jgi:hypothetical protein
MGVTGCMFNCVGSAGGAAGAVVPPPELAAGSE